MVVHAEPPQRAAVEGKLLEALARPGCTDAARQFICEMLALVGSARSVPALAALLEKPATADAARYALEPILDTAADEALRAALPKLTGAPKAGLIGTIALRGDASALPALVTIQENASETSEVRAAAARAITRLRKPA